MRNAMTAESTERRIRLCIACSIDGYIAGPSGEIDWLFDPASVDLGDFFGSVDTILMGRKTYDFAAGQGHGGGGMPGQRTFVFTRSAKPPGGPGVEFVSAGPHTFVERLRSEPGKDVWLMGGGELLASFLAEDQVDEMILAVHPIVLGDGIPLFPGRHDRIPLELVSCEASGNGLVVLIYRRPQAT